MDVENKNIFYLIGGAVAAGKSTFMENRIYNATSRPINFFDHDREKLMIQLYAQEEQNFIKNITVGKALNNAIKDSLDNDKDFALQVHFSNEQLPQINTYFHKYGTKFSIQAHFIAVDKISILEARAARRERLSGHSSDTKTIEKTYKQSYNNFINYIPKLEKATVWDNSEEYGIYTMKPQFIYEKGLLTYENPGMTVFAGALLEKAKVKLKTGI